MFGLCGWFLLAALAFLGVGAQGEQNNWGDGYVTALMTAGLMCGVVAVLSGIVGAYRALTHRSKLRLRSPLTWQPDKARDFPTAEASQANPPQQGAEPDERRASRDQQLAGTASIPTLISSRAARTVDDPVPPAPQVTVGFAPIEVTWDALRQDLWDGVANRGLGARFMWLNVGVRPDLNKSVRNATIEIKSLPARYNSSSSQSIRFVPGREAGAPYLPSPTQVKLALARGASIGLVPLVTAIVLAVLRPGQGVFVVFLVALALVSALGGMLLEAAALAVQTSIVNQLSAGRRVDQQLSIADSGLVLALGNGERIEALWTAVSLGEEGRDWLAIITPMTGRIGIPRAAFDNSEELLRFLAEVAERARRAHAPPSDRFGEDAPERLPADV
jgi:hypothetical protein